MELTCRILPEGYMLELMNVPNLTRMKVATYLQVHPEETFIMSRMSFE